MNNLKIGDTIKCSHQEEMLSTIRKMRKAGIRVQQTDEIYKLVVIGFDATPWKEDEKKNDKHMC